MNVAVAGTKEAILMVEAGAKEVSEQVMLDAILFGHEEIKKLVAFQEQIQAEVGKPKMEFTPYVPPEALSEEIMEYGEPKIHDALMDPDKLHRDKMVSETKEAILEHFVELYPESEIDIAILCRSLSRRSFVTSLPMIRSVRTAVPLMRYVLSAAKLVFWPGLMAAASLHAVKPRFSTALLWRRSAKPDP